MPQIKDKILTAYFFKTPAGNEPVREWLKLRKPDEKKQLERTLKLLNILGLLGIHR